MPPSLPASLLSAFENGTVLAESGEVLPLDLNVNQTEAEALLECVTAHRARRTAEVGLAKGVSATAICAGLSHNGGGEHHVMDPFQHGYSNAGLRMLRDCGFSDIFRFYPSYAEEIFPTLEPLDFVFIDASHLFDFTLLEFILADKRLKVGGRIAFHDLWMPSLRKAVRYILRNRAYEIDVELSARAVPPHEQNASPNLKERLADVLAAGTRLVPRARVFFTDELRNPWHRLGLGNMVFLSKLDEDKRDWTQFSVF